MQEHVICLDAFSPSMWLRVLASVKLFQISKVSELPLIIEYKEINNYLVILRILGKMCCLQSSVENMTFDIISHYLYTKGLSGCEMSVAILLAILENALQKVLHRKYWKSLQKSIMIRNICTEYGDLLLLYCDQKPLVQQLDKQQRQQTNITQVSNQVTTTHKLQ